MIHKITLSGYSATTDDISGVLILGTYDSYGIERIQLELGPEWNALVIKATFNPPTGSEPVTVVADTSGQLRVPQEATSSAGQGAITFVGTAAGLQRISTDLPYIVKTHSQIEGATPSPTPSEWEQFVAQVQQARDDAEAAAQAAEDSKTAAADRASNAAESAEKAAQSAQKAQNIVDGAVQYITAAKNAAVQEVNTVGNIAVQKVQQAQSTGVQAVQEAQNTAMQAVQTAQTAGVKAVNDAGDAKVEEIEQINALVPMPTPEDAGKVVVVKPDGTGYEFGDAGSEIDDTVVAPDTTWSSLNIVNKLCPPFSVTGDAVQFSPVEGYPLSVQSTIVATQEGTGDPSPTNVRPIVPVNEAGIWWIAGDNVLNLNHVELGTFSTVNGEPTESATQYRTAYKVPCTKNSVLYQSNNKNLNVRVFVWNESGGFVASEAVVSGGSYTFTVDGYFAIVSGTSGFAADHYVGFSKTAAPYVGKDYTVPLNEPCYVGTVDLTGGKFSKTFGVTIVDGTTVKFTTNAEKTYYNLPGNSSPNVSQLATDNMLSSHFPYIIWSKNGIYDFIFSTAERMAPYFSNVDELNAYCQQQYAAGTPVTIAYPLEIAETVGINPLAIPAPASPATAYSTSGEITVSGRSDPVEYINQQIANAIAIAKV